jgi:DNA-binding response OmpR family regulator
MARILVVDSEADVRVLIADLLADAGHEVHRAADGAEALAHLDEAMFDLILGDLTLPAIEGLGLYREIASRWPELVSRLVYVTGTIVAESTEYRILLDEGIPLVLKPFHAEHLLDVVRSALARRR